MIQKDLQGNLWECKISGTRSNGKTFQAYQQEIERLNNIINELEQWLEREKDIQGTIIEGIIFNKTLDKLKELKE